MEKNKLVVLAIIAFVIIFSYVITTKNSVDTDEEIIKCIGENSELYIMTYSHTLKGRVS